MFASALAGRQVFPHQLRQKAFNGNLPVVLGQALGTSTARPDLPTRRSQQLSEAWPKLFGPGDVSDGLDEIVR